MKPLIAITGVVIQPQKKNLASPKKQDMVQMKIVPINNVEKPENTEDGIHAAVANFMAESFVRNRQEDFRKFHLAYLGFGIKEN